MSCCCDSYSKLEPIGPLIFTLVVSNRDQPLIVVIPENKRYGIPTDFWYNEVATRLEVPIESITISSYGKGCDGEYHIHTLPKGLMMCPEEYLDDLTFRVTID